MLDQPIVQIAYFVNDARAAAQSMHRQYGAGPFFLLERIELAWGEHRGRPQTFVHTSAYGQWGPLMMELVQQDEEGPSPFRDLFAPGEQGLHHMAMMVESMPDTYAFCKDAQLEIAARAATANGTEFAFIDTVARQGHMLEVYEGSEALKGFYAMVRKASENWDGSDILRPLS